MKKIYLIRHGESEGNVKGLYSGWLDTPLTDQGRGQAQQAAERLKGIDFDRVISSDLSRTRETAQIVCGKYLNAIEEDNRFREMHFGIFEGLTYKEICEKYPEEMQAWGDDYSGYIIPDGESLEMMAERCCKRFKEIVFEMTEGNIIISAHAGVIRSILSEVVGTGAEGYWKFKIDNCGIASIEYVDDYPVICGLNQ